MAELADALDLGSSGVTRTGSIPASRTKTDEIRYFFPRILGANNEKKWRFFDNKFSILSFRY